MINVIIIIWAIWVNIGFLSVTIEIIANIFNIKLIYTPNAFAYMVLLLLLIIYHTPISNWLITLKFKRVKSGRYWDLFKEVCIKAKENPNNYKLYVENKSDNAGAIKNNIIVIGNLLTDKCSIMAVMAHELAHLKYKDSYYTGMSYFINIIAYYVLNFWYLMGSAIQIIPFAPIRLFGIIIIFITKCLEVIMYFPLIVVDMFFSRQKEYRADKYSCELGFGNGLYAYLSKSLEGKRNWFFATHPKIKNRLDRIEKECKKIYQKSLVSNKLNN